MKMLEEAIVKAVNICSVHVQYVASIFSCCILKFVVVYISRVLKVHILPAFFAAEWWKV